MHATSLDWLKMDIARSYGLDKATWAKRLEWTNEHLRLGYFPDGAKEPFLYDSACKALKAAMNGQPVDHLISLDATASGIQCLSLMAQDAESAESVNLGSDRVNNPYQRVKDHMGDYPYERVKKALMTSFYESVATPLQLFGDDYNKFVEAAMAMLPGPWLMKEAISNCMTFKEFYGWTMMDGFEVNMEVTTPVECSMDIGSGHVMSWIEHRRAGVATKGLTANVTHSLDAMVLREVLRRTHCPYQWYPDNELKPFEEVRDKDLALMQSILRWQRSEFLSFEFMDHVDAHNQHLVPQELRNEVDQRLTRDDMYVQPIHDCYRVRANDANDLFIIVREVMADLAYAKTAWWILSQLGYAGTINDDPVKRSNLRSLVLRSQYLIC